MSRYFNYRIDLMKDGKVSSVRSYTPACAKPLVRRSAFENVGEKVYLTQEVSQSSQTRNLFRWFYWFYVVKYLSDFSRFSRLRRGQSHYRTALLHRYKGKQNNFIFQTNSRKNFIQFKIPQKPYFFAAFYTDIFKLLFSQLARRFVKRSLKLARADAVQKFRTLWYSPSLFNPHVLALTHNGEAAWRRRGGHNRLLEPQTVNSPRKVIRSYTPACAKPLVSGSAFCQSFVFSFLYSKYCLIFSLSNAFI